MSGQPAHAAIPPNYAEVLDELKRQVRSAHAKAALAVNRELIELYLAIGRQLAVQQGGWGSKVVERLARDLRAEFPDIKGFSRTNLFNMRRVYLAWEGASETVQQLVGQIPWGHHVVLVSKLEDSGAREFCLRKTVENGWSRAILGVQIESGLHERQGRALTNFASTLPEPAGELAREALKDPYVFDFLTLGEQAREEELERALLEHIQRFLLELGVGFAFVGRQVHLEAGERDFYLDLLFCHLRLRCFVVIELKVVPFEPEHVGKLNFYLSLVDDQLRHEADGPTIGLLLCKEKNRVLVEYALRDVAKPVGVSEWTTRIVESLPEDLEDRLPSVEQLEAELSRLPGGPADEDKGEER